MGHRGKERKRSREPDAQLYDSLLAFVHIPRSGGGTVTTAIADSYARPKSAGNYQRSPEKSRRGVQTVGADPRRWRAMADHVPYGLYRRYPPPCTLYLTVLREPVDRVLSHYQFHARAGGEKLAKAWTHLSSLD